MTRVLAIMAKWPEPGQVKTRLAAAIGGAEAAAVHLEMLRETVRTQFGRGYTDVLAVSPDASRGPFGELFPEVTRMAQGGGDLGERMDRVTAALTAGRTSLVLLGGDSPDLPARHVATAFEWLESGDIVLGPSTDGGFYLIGLKRVHAGLYDGVEWGTGSVFGTVVANAARLGLRVMCLLEWTDVDTMAGLDAWRERVGARS